MKKKQLKRRNYRLEYKRKQPLDTEGLAQVLLEMASELPSEDQDEFVEQAEAIIERLKDRKKRAA